MVVIPGVAGNVIRLVGNEFRLPEVAAAVPGPIAIALVVGMIVGIVAGLAPRGAGHRCRRDTQRVRNRIGNDCHWR